MYTQNAITEKSQAIANACQRGVFKGVIACVLGAKCQAPLLVTVPVHPGFELDTRNVDLHWETYLLTDPSKISYMRHLDEFGVCLRSIASPARRKERWFWTIFLPYPERETGKSEPWNEVYESFKAGDGRNAVKGNILVIKSNNNGIVCDVEERDLGHIEWVVYQFLESVADKGVTKLKHVYHPLLEQFQRSSPLPWSI